MKWSAFLLVVLLGSSAASFSDWLMMGVLFHDKYRAAPEIWRPTAPNSNRARILVSQTVGALCCAAFAYLCFWLHALTIATSVGAALLVWLAGPVVVYTQMVQWMKLHPLIGISHALGWLVRLLITGVLAVELLA